MSAEITGVNEIIKQLKRELGTKWNRVENKALNAGAQVVAKEIFQDLSAFKDTGTTVDEIVVGKPKKKGGYKHVLVGWEGPKQRYRLIHLNEFGYTRDGKQYSPKAKGAITKAMNEVQPKFKAEIEKELRKHL